MKASREEKVESQIIRNLQSTTEVLSLAQMGNINLPLVIKSGAAINHCWRLASSKSKSQLIMNGPLLTESEENRAPRFVQIMEGGKDIYKKIINQNLQKLIENCLRKMQLKICVRPNHKTFRGDCITSVWSAECSFKEGELAASDWTSQKHRLSWRTNKTQGQNTKYSTKSTKYRI